MPNVGPLQLAIVLLIVLVIFGPKRLPDLGRQLGSGMREFKNSITGRHDDDEDEEFGSQPQVTAASQERVAEEQRDDTKVSGS